ncbi:unnamed protein product [Symbiodinium natans]|uniref:PPM-type phosphatase domain-containing protein n=1 Tax=Symbiodinium natans TaxID=878477 RepID=A0A812INP6_9DINO|nr:unnamed protein product [Symbiodinium natans]
MAEAAHASYECLGRYEMDVSYTTRTAMNTAAMKGKSGEIYRICQKIGAADLDGLQEDDDRLVQQHGLQEFAAQPGEITLFPPELLEGLRCRCGLALPLQRGKKATFTKALSGLMSKNNIKVSGALGQAAAADLIAERGFVSRCGDWCLIGLVNGQGSPKVSGALTMYVAQEMPKAIFRSPAFVNSFPDVAKGLTDAFAKVHTSAAMQLDVTLTGASVTVVLLNTEHVWIAHVGDCRCVLAVPDTSGNAREFHMLPQRLTEDHKLCVKKEFDRAKDAGAEVRKLVHDKVCRLFVGESSYPSLALTRGLGHRLGHTVGVSHKPSICKLVRKDLPEGSYMLLGSGGVWATVSDTTAVNWVTRNLDDPQQAAMSLAHEAMSRWQEPGSLAKGNLNGTMPDCFGTFMIQLSENDKELQSLNPRKFVPGSEDITDAIKLPWRQADHDIGNAKRGTGCPCHGHTKQALKTVDGVMNECFGWSVSWAHMHGAGKRALLAFAALSSVYARLNMLYEEAGCQQLARSGMRAFERYDLALQADLSGPVELKTKKSFVNACAQLTQISEQWSQDSSQPSVQALQEAAKAVFTALQTRFSNPKFWQAGLDLFLALEFHVPAITDAGKWRDAALEEVDEEARERAKEQARLRRLQEDKMHNKGQFGDAATPLSLGELLASQGLVLVEEDDRRPGMSRDARAELRVKTVLEEDVCVVCQEAMPAGSKAKAMPCGHLFHDDCLLSWVKKSNSCPTCRFDDMPSEKRHYDDVQRQVMERQPGLYS